MDFVLKNKTLNFEYANKKIITEGRVENKILGSRADLRESFMNFL